MASNPTLTNSKTHQQWVHNGYTFSRVIHKTPELSTKPQFIPGKNNRFVAGETL
jgi:hypothetical protein